MNWLIAQEYQDVISEITDIPEKLPAEAQIIKENMVRQSSVIPLPGHGEIFVKRYKMKGWGETLKYLFLPFKADREWRNILFFKRYHLPTVTSVAKGIKRQGGLLKDSLLVTQHIPGCQTLKAFSQSVRDQPSRDYLTRKRAIINEAARKIRMIHEKGFFYRDLHAGNILIQEDPSGKFTLFFVDLHKAWHLGRTPLLARIRDLAQLKNSLPSTRSDWIRFLKAYLKEVDPPLLMIAGEIDRYAERLERAHLKSRTRRCLMPSSEFMAEKSFRKSLYGKKSYGKDIFNAVFDEYRKARGQGKIRIIKEQPKSFVSLLSIPRNGGHQTICIKEFTYPGLFYALRCSFRKSRALKSWVGANGLRVRGFSTPEPLALCEEKKGGILKRSILLLEYLDGVEELNDYILKNFDLPVSLEKERKKKNFIACLSCEIRGLHAQGIYQADLKSNNILVKEKNGGFEFFFIDLDRVRFGQKLSYRERVKNLAQINASVADCITISDRLQFFRSYAARTPLLLQKKNIYRNVLKIGRTKVTEPYGLNFKKSI